MLIFKFETKRFLVLLSASLGTLSAQAQGLKPIVNVLDTKVLNALELSGFSLGENLGGKKSVSQCSELYSSSSYYRSFADTLAKPLPHDSKTDQLPDFIPENSGDIPDMLRRLRGFEDKGARSDKDSKGGFFIRHVANNSQYPYEVEYDGDEPRHFDARWLASQYGFMKLVAVVNRMDRSEIIEDSCGEVRFVYRLSYRSAKSSSSLPFFVTSVHEYPKKLSCAEFAKSWQLASLDAKSLAKGPLKGLKFRQLELNFQSLRFTSGYMHDFGGQAMYMQRVFKKSGSALVPTHLENTPDVLAILKDPSLLKRFVEFLKQPGVLQKLDLGTLDINFDPKFLAKLSVSWSTLGRARDANRPYSKIFEKDEQLLKSIDISKLKYIKTHAALVERLNNLTCMGCHQAGGTAGFHTLGLADSEFSHPFNRQELPLSPHASADVPRREAWLAAVASGRKPNSFRPHSSFGPAVWEASIEIPDFNPIPLGQLCFKNSKDFSSTPVCADSSGRNLECRQTVISKSKSVLLGECVLREAVSAAGSVCWQGELTESANLHLDRKPPVYNFFAFTDKWKLTGAVISQRKPYTCVLPQSGAPLGRMSRRCTLSEENFEVDFAKKIPDEICANQGGSGFDLCAARGDSGACLETKVARAMLDTCSSDRHCREDYICQKFPDYHKISDGDYVRYKGKALVNLSQPKNIKGRLIEEARRRGVGFCVPTYFLFNMRLDGHPSPVTGLAPGSPEYDRTKPLRGYKSPESGK